MIYSQDEESEDQPNLTRHLAAHLVDQVLEEACQKAGTFWRYLLMLEQLDETNLETGHVVDSSRRYSEGTIFNMEKYETEIVHTSTPQKSEQIEEPMGDVADDKNCIITCDEPLEANKLDLISDITDNDVEPDIGQGDVDLIPLSFMRMVDALAATPKIDREPVHLNHTYNIIEFYKQTEMGSELEYHTENHPENPFHHPNDVPEDTCINITNEVNISKDDYDNIVNDILCKSQEVSVHIENGNEENTCQSNEVGYALLNYIKEDSSYDLDVLESGQREVNKTDLIESGGKNFEEEPEIVCQESKANEKPAKADVGLLERTYLTLNRDEEPFSDAESCSETATKRLPMHEVDLLVASASEGNIEVDLSDCVEVDLPEESNKTDSLSRRCRQQGSRLWSWLRSIIHRRLKIRKLHRRPKVPQLSNHSPIMRQRKMSRSKLYSFDPVSDVPDGTWRSVPGDYPYARRKFLETYV